MRLVGKKMAYRKWWRDEPVNGRVRLFAYDSNFYDLRAEAVAFPLVKGIADKAVTEVLEPMEQLILHVYSEGNMAGYTAGWQQGTHIFRASFRRRIRAAWAILRGRTPGTVRINLHN